MTEHFTAEDGTRLAYRDEGAGLPVLALSGLTRTMADFDYLVPHLPPVRLIRMDYRGRGGSEWSGQATYNIPQEARDAVALLDHLGVEKAALIGSSRGGLVGFVLALTARARLSGILLNDVGPEIPQGFLDRLYSYLGRRPVAATYEEMATLLPRVLPGFEGVPHARWLEEARRQYRQGPEGLEINYDPALRDAFLAAQKQPHRDAWPAFDACAGLPLAVIHAQNSDLLTPRIVAEMRRRRPDMILGEVPGRGHLPFLDEPEALAVVRTFLEACA